jgi:hypothetical protein
VPADVAAGLAWRTHACDLLRAKREDGFQRLDLGISYITSSTAWLALSMRLTMGNKICPLLWQNCSITAADSFAARVTI